MKDKNLIRDGVIKLRSNQDCRMHNFQINGRDELWGAKEELNYSPVTIPQSI
jgi:hypothetical protein